ncbi:MAG: DUF5320 domain-containing protein [Desulforhabdus sp.]|jgi:hypothetical protein|nr:DUF5320 domain-containing protein [Desulforhabdus sp.]
MPGGDRTGPRGFGPMTGRGMGWCAGADREYVTAWQGPGRGYGYGYGPGRVNVFGWGRGRGRRHRYYATGVPGWARYGWGDRWAGPPPYAGWAPPVGDELGSLKEYAAELEEQLADIKSRMAELEQERKAPTSSEG